MTPKPEIDMFSLWHVLLIPRRLCGFRKVSRWIIQLKLHSAMQPINWSLVTSLGTRKRLTQNVLRKRCPKTERRTCVMNQVLHGGFFSRIIHSLGNFQLRSLVKVSWKISNFILQVHVSPGAEEIPDRIWYIAPPFLWFWSTLKTFEGDHCRENEVLQIMFCRLESPMQLSWYIFYLKWSKGTLI